MRHTIKIASEKSAATETAATAIHCNTCRANCCKLEVILMGEDDIPAELIHIDRWGGHVMARLDDGWCAALNRDTMLCTIYERRPGVCRDYEMGGDDCRIERATLQRTPLPLVPGT